MVRVSPEIPKLLISAAPDEESGTDDRGSRKISAGIYEESNANRVRKRNGKSKGEQNQEDDEDPYESGDEEVAETVTKTFTHPHEYYHTKKRLGWWQKKDFLILAAGSCIGITNIADFPVHALSPSHGGTAYTICYIIMLATLVLPLIYLEMIVGQYIQKGLLGVGNLCPILKGLGISMLLAASFIPLWYVLEMSWSIKFMLEAMDLSPVAWNDCKGDWNTEYCISVTNAVKLVKLSKANLSTNTTSRLTILTYEEFYRHRILKEELDSNRSSVYHLGNLGHSDKWLSLCVTFVYLIILFSLGFTHRVAGKLGWVSAFLPALCLSVLIFRALSLPGAFRGFSLLNSDYTKLLKFETWTEASFHAVRSTGAGCGIHLTLASYNDFNRPILRFAIITIVVDFAFSVLSTVMVYAYIGELSFREQVENPHLIAAIVTKSNMVFEVLPGMIGSGNLKDSSIFIFIFFFMVMQMGIPKIITCYECFLTGIMDEYRSFFERHKYGRVVLTFIVVAASGLTCLSCTSPGGIYIYLLLKTAFGGPTFIIAGILFMLSIAGLVGTVAIRNALHVMYGHLKLFLYFEICWSLLIFGHIVLAGKNVLDSFRKDVPKWYETPLPLSAFRISIAFIYLPFLPIPIYGMYWMFRNPAPTFRLRWLLGISPEHEHAQIMETGVGVREKCQQCCCISYFTRSRLISSTNIPTTPAPAPPDSDNNHELQTRDSEVDSNRKFDPDGRTLDRQETVPPPGSAAQEADEVKTATNFIKNEKNWKNMSLNHKTA